MAGSHAEGTARLVFADVAVGEAEPLLRVAALINDDGQLVQVSLSPMWADDAGQWRECAAPLRIPGDAAAAVMLGLRDVLGRAAEAMVALADRAAARG